MMNPSKYLKNFGLSLVELMVAITISSVLLLGVSSVYLSTRSSNAVQDEFSRLQENGRFAISTLIKDMRQAGYLGCFNLATVDTFNNVDGGGSADPTYQLNANNALTGHLGCASNSCTPATPVDLSTPGIIDGTQAMTIRSVSSCSSTLTGNMGVNNANIQLTDNSCGFDNGDILTISDCKDADIFQATTVSDASGKITIAHSNAGNISSFLNKIYGQDARVMQWQRSTYFIGPSTGDPSSNSLYVNRAIGGEASAVTIELVENVDDMQFDYYIDSNLDDPDSTEPANADGYMNGVDFLAALTAGTINWGNVIAVRIHLLLATRDNVAKLNAGKAETPYTFMGIKYKSSDRRYRREFTTTVNLRNRTL
jgi:type IV pilus assembly protein PilW